MNNSARRINALSHGLLAQSYLEIGVETGETFVDIEAAVRTAVDPQFSFDTDLFADGNTHFHRKRSDDYFAEMPSDEVFDLIFIDGLHKFEQVVRDLSNSIIHSHARSVIVIDDTVPSNVFSAMPDVGDSVRFRERAGVEDSSWHGDVYKIVFYLHDFWPSLSYRTIIGSGNPQTVVWRSNGFRRASRFDNLEVISRLTYYQLIDNLDVLRECEENVAITEILSDLRR